MLIEESLVGHLSVAFSWNPLFGSPFEGRCTNQSAAVSGRGPQAGYLGNKTRMEKDVLPK